MQYPMVFYCVFHMISIDSTRLANRTKWKWYVDTKWINMYCKMLYMYKSNTLLFRELIEYFRNQFSLFLLGKLGNLHTVQHFFVKLDFQYRKLNEWYSRASWMYTIAIASIYKYARKQIDCKLSRQWFLNLMIKKK